MSHTSRFLGLLVLVCGCSSSFVSAQGFIKAVKEQGQIVNNRTTVVMMDGSEANGKMEACMFSMGALKSFTLKDDAGGKTKYKAADLEGMRVKVDKMMKLDMFMDGGSIVGIATTDFEEIANRDHVIFERALMPGKKQKYRLLQVVNPGFDSRLKVYFNPSPNAKETSGFLGITGGDPKSYLVVKDGSRSIKVKKDEYKKQFAELFGDCAVMTSSYTKKNQKWDYFPEHVFVYDQQCKP